MVIFSVDLLIIPFNALVCKMSETKGEKGISPSQVNTVKWVVFVWPTVQNTHTHIYTYILGLLSYTTAMQQIDQIVTFENWKK